jgi:hypothetical protein
MRLLFFVCRLSFGSIHLEQDGTHCLQSQSLHPSKADFPALESKQVYDHPPNLESEIKDAALPELPTNTHCIDSNPQNTSEKSETDNSEYIPEDRGIPNNSAFFTYDGWKFDFPENADNPKQSCEEYLMVQKVNGIYEVVSETVSDCLQSYIPIINQALTLFNPSDKDLFDSKPFIKVVREDRVVNARGTSKPSYLHVDHAFGGYIGEDGKIYYGVVLANNIDDTCYIVPDILTEENTVENLEKLKSKFNQEDFGYQKANQLYWITSFTPHHAIAMKQDTYRRLLIIGLGAYLHRSSRIEFDEAWKKQQSEKYHMHNFF